MPSIAPLWLRLCPSCDGEAPARDACATCVGAGVLDQNDEPFAPPEPLDRLSPGQLVGLDREARERDQGRRARRLSTTTEGWRMARTENGEPVALPERPRKLTLSEILELLLTRDAPDHSSVRLSRNAKGATQIEVYVTSAEPGIESIEGARAKAEAQYDHLRELYPMPGGGT